MESLTDDVFKELEKQQEQQYKQRLAPKKQNIVNAKPWAKRLMYTEQNTIKSNSPFNVKLIIENDEFFRKKIGRNEFDGYNYLLKPMGNHIPAMWSDDMESTARIYIEQEYMITVSYDNLRNAINSVALENKFNPVKEYIESVEWDKTKRLETLFIDCLGVEDSIYSREVTKRWVVGSVARVYEPACKFEIVPILEGKQGIGKSTILKRLYGEKYFMDNLQTMGDNKDDIINLRGVVIAELSELESMNKSSIAKIKQFISTTTDIIRMPYGRNSEKLQRTNVFVGTTNTSNYLKDRTANRRFYPLPCRNEPTKDLFNLDDDYFKQVIAEAYELYKANYKIYFDKEDEDILLMAEAYRDKAMIIDPIEERVLRYIDMLVPADWLQVDYYARKKYFMKYPNNNDTSGFNYGDVLIKQSTIPSEIFAQDISGKEELTSTALRQLHQKIKMYMDNQEGWEYKQLGRKFSNRRGYYNEKNEQENIEILKKTKTSNLLVDW
ncbi:virulence-associated E family protein [Enterococcus cecorum]